VRLIPSCRETSELLSQAEDRPLTFREKVLVHVHLPLCNGCRNFREQLGFIRRAARRYASRD
jgi:predicted anti-sigma-YlaC factor YlaD